MQLALRASKGFTTPLPATTGDSGAPEVPSGYPKSPPSSFTSSSLRSAYNGRHAPTAASSMKGASRTIAKECERLFCGDMRQIFLGVRNDPSSVTRSMGSIKSSSGETKNGNHNAKYEYSYLDANGREMRFVEVWDYVGKTSFRGFIAEKELPRGRVERSLFLFFEDVAGTQLKSGLMALIELASECFECDRLILCVERNGEGIQSFIRDLGWVGFELVTLAPWAQDPPTTVSMRKASFSSTMSAGSSCSYSSSVYSEDEVTSEKWIFVGMEL